MLICERCKVEMQCEKNGVKVCIRPALDPGDPGDPSYVYAGDTFSCPRCRSSIIKTNNTGFYTVAPCESELSQWKSGNPIDEHASVYITYTPEMPSFEALGSDLKAIGVAVSNGVLSGDNWEVVGGNAGGPLRD